MRINKDASTSISGVARDQIGQIPAKQNLQQTKKLLSSSMIKYHGFASMIYAFFDTAL